MYANYPWVPCGLVGHIMSIHTYINSRVRYAFDVVDAREDVRALSCAVTLSGSEQSTVHTLHSAHSAQEVRYYSIAV